MEADKSLVSGSMALLVLKLLEDGDKYGYQMTSELTAAVGGRVPPEGGDPVPPAPQPGGKGAGHRLRAGGRRRQAPAVLPSDKGGGGRPAGEGGGVAHLCRCRGPCAGGRCLLCRDLRASGAIWTRWRHQIRWKRARTVAARELATHLEDQQEEFLAEGHPPEEAERLAVEEMGDPVAVGADLDRLHRPRPQWGMLGLTLALLLVGGWLRYALTRAGAPWDEDLDPLRCALSVVTGAAVLVGAYFLDVSRLLRWAKWVYIGAVAAGVLSLHLSPTVNNASYFTRYVVLFYPAVYALWLYACRGKGWRGLLAAVAGGIPLTVVCMCAPFIQGMIQLMVIGCFLLLLAIQMDWFTVPRRQGLAAVGGLAAVMAGAVLWLLLVAGYNAARIQILLHPEIDPQGAGYQAVMARRILGASRLMGKGGDLSIQPNTVQGMELPPEMMLPEWNHDFLPTTMVYKLGWLPYLLLLAVLAVLLLWMLRRCACQQSQSGKLLALAVVLTLAVQSAFAAALNLGFVLFSAQLPLVTGNLHSMVDCALIGLALSAFRSESILRDAVVPVPRPPQTQTA